MTFQKEGSYTWEATEDLVKQGIASKQEQQPCKGRVEGSDSQLQGPVLRPQPEKFSNSSHSDQ